MAIKTYTEQLESVQAAIAKIESGTQSSVYNGRTITRADLEQLYMREKWLRTKASQESAVVAGQTGRNTIRYVVPD